MAAVLRLHDPLEAPTRTWYVRFAAADLGSAKALGRLRTIESSSLSSLKERPASARVSVPA